MKHRTRSRAGFTLLEMTLAVSLLGIVVYKTFSIMDATTKATSTDTSSIVLEEQTHLILERIARSIMASSRESLAPASEAPLHSQDIRYQVDLGIQDGEVVWSDPEQIALEEASSTIFWRQNPDDFEERRLAWTKLVRPFLQGELPNGMDDNGNGIIDEKGLSFTVDRNAISIRLSLEREVDGKLVGHTVETVVTCRNLPGEGS